MRWTLSPKAPTSFDQVVQDRGLTCKMLILAMSQKPLWAMQVAIVFGSTEPGVTGPANTDLGPALFRVNAILDGNIQTFKMVRDQLRTDAALDVAIGEIAGISEEVDDLLAGGATLEDVAAETQMELGSIDWHLATEDGISAMKNFKLQPQT